jgi:hypothetical protein
MDSISLNIAILPDKKTSQLAIALSQSLAKVVPAKFILNDINPIPHLTIYQAHFPLKNLGKIENIISEIVLDLKSFELTLGPFSATTQGNIWWNCVNQEEMKQIQTKIVKRCNLLREGQILPILKTYRGIDSEQAMVIKKYGSMWVGKQYSPHISVSGVDDIYIEKVLETLGKEKQASFLVDGIIIGKLGDYGTVTEIIKNFPLSS